MSGELNQLARLEGELSGKGIRFTPLGLELPEDLDMEGWAAVGRRLCRADQVMKWWLGDWAAFGLHKYDEGRRQQRVGEGPPPMGLKEFAAANGINYQTLANLAWVSRSVDVSRRREDLEWSKHAEVAALKPAEQVRWLARAEEESLPVARLRQEIRMAQGEHNALQADGPAMRFVTRAVDELMAWLRGRPDEFWSQDRREVWRERLRPVAEFFEWLEQTTR